MENSFYFLWDYNLSNKEFLEILDGQLEKGRLDQDWAITRLLEYGKYDDIIRLLGYKNISVHWPRLREQVRSEGRRRGFDFLVEWLPKNHPELLAAILRPNLQFDLLNSKAQEGDRPSVSRKGETAEGAAVSVLLQVRAQRTWRR